MNETRHIAAVILFCLVCAAAAAAQSRAVVTGERAELRNRPDARKGRVAFTVRKGASLRVDRKKHRKGWRYVTHKNKKGWVRTERIRLLVDEPKRRATWLFIGRSPRMNGFSVAYYLNATQLVRNGKTVSFWSKMVPSNRKPYLETFMARQPKRKAADFDYNVDQWEGDCKTKRVRVVKSLLYWKNGRVENARVSKGKTDVSGNSAARSILREACKIGKKLE